MAELGSECASDFIHQPAITSSKLTIETLERRNDATDVVLVSLLLTLNIFHTLF